MATWEELERDNRQDAHDSRMRQLSNKPARDSSGFSNYCPKCGSADYTEGTYHEDCNSCGYSVRY